MESLNVQKMAPGKDFREKIKQIESEKEYVVPISKEQFYKQLMEFNQEVYNGEIKISDTKFRHRDFELKFTFHQQKVKIQKVYAKEFQKICKMIKEYTGLWEGPQDVEWPMVGTESILARCLTVNEIWDEYRNDSDFKRCIYPGVLDPQHKIGIRAYSREDYYKFPLLFDTAIQLLHKHPPGALHKRDFSPISKGFNSPNIVSVTITASRNL